MIGSDFFFNRLLWLHHGGSSEGKVSDYGLSRKATMAACPSKGKWVCVCECVWRKKWWCVNIYTMQVYSKYNSKTRVKHCGGRRVTLTKFCSQRPRNCWNFCDISSWALPTALRTFPKTEREGGERLSRAQGLVSPPSLPPQDTSHHVVMAASLHFIYTVINPLVAKDISWQ